MWLSRLGLLPFQVCLLESRGGDVGAVGGRLRKSDGGRRRCGLYLLDGGAVKAGWWVLLQGVIPSKRQNRRRCSLSLATKAWASCCRAEKREGLYIGRGLFLPSLGGIVRQSRGRRDQGRESAERQDPSHSLCGSVRACAVACGLSLCHCLVSPRPVPPSAIPR